MPFAQGSMEGVLLTKILPHLLYTAQGGPDYDHAAAENTGGQSALWPLGISGDLPILLASPSEHPEEMAPYLRICRRLALCGLPVDLALLDSGLEPEKLRKP